LSFVSKSLLRERDDMQRLKLKMRIPWQRECIFFFCDSSGTGTLRRNTMGENQKEENQGGHREARHEAVRKSGDRNREENSRGGKYE
jgi:hypothetical protein